MAIKRLGLAVAAMPTSPTLFDATRARTRPLAMVAIASLPRWPMSTWRPGKLQATGTGRPRDPPAKCGTDRIAGGGWGNYSSAGDGSRISKLTPASANIAVELRTSSAQRSLKADSGRALTTRITPAWISFAAQRAHGGWVT